MNCIQNSGDPRVAPPEARRASTRSRRAIATLCVAVGAALALPAATIAADAAPRGSVVRVKNLGSMSGERVAGTLAHAGIAGPAPRTGVVLLRVVYRTITPQGAPTRASGLLVLPRERSGRLPLVSYTHGTISARENAPSVGELSDGRIAGLLFASAGMGAFAPDYLGLGVGPGLHPYADARSEASAALDGLRAARTVAAKRGARLDARVLVTGFSQGGQAAMALARSLQSGPRRALTLRALAPISGPYDLSGAEWPAIFDGRLGPANATFYLAYALTAWNRLGTLYPSAADAFAAPYAGIVEQLFDGRHDEVTVARALPGRPRDLLAPAFLPQVEHPTGAMLARLREEDTCDWTPRSPVRLFGATGDRDITFDNARRCAHRLAALGVDVRLRSVGDVDHFTSARLALPRVLRWFQAAG